MREPNTGSGGFWGAFRSKSFFSHVNSLYAHPSAQQIAFIRSLNKGQRRPETLHIPLTELQTTVFDLETTGFHAQHGDEILSFGAINMQGSVNKEQEIHLLSRPERTIPLSILELTGITQEMASSAPPMVEALHGFMTFVSDRVLVAHCSGHDKAFLDQALWKTSKTRLSHRVLDTMIIATKLNPNLGIMSLDEWLNFYQIPITRRHNALQDAKMTATLWACLLEELQLRNVLTLGDLYIFLSKY
ncbi:DNA polymerase-3 subunit epsilon [Paenibacillus shirakamiensis]|uniref:DNA polymerase-3 subunit epsilon n=1 Tax=Paenibacillus shirakamiensis TaxID=1265935 RepID=A0ABS4JHV7_9BACL|nr:exonuclease domain-containing protein [Paenibacillus shirakamiensis]MBP2001277.1 DNA polymerase-3 subunit epsilon [Paenibacillus shirakamiensis]